MTRFGKFLPLWNNFKSLGQIFKGYLELGKKCNLTLAQMLCFGQVFIVVDGQILLKIEPSGHID